MSEESAPSYVVVPLDKISDEALHGLINEFILREGTDYGAREFTLIDTGGWAIDATAAREPVT